MASSFNIQVDDGSTLLSEYAVTQNTSFIQLHDWQERAIKYFFEKKNVIFEVSTGAGKSFCSIVILKKLLEQEPNLKILIVVPKNVILEKTWFKELYDAGISIRDIGIYYGAIKEYGKITITNMQSLHKIALEMFSVVVWDEIHNYYTKRLRPFMKHNFKYKIGLSATIEEAEGRHWEIIKLFDYNVFKYDAKEALNDGVLNSFDFINIGIKMDYDSYNKYEKLTQELNTILQSGGGFKKIMRENTGLKNRMLKKLNERKQLINNYPGKFEVLKSICSKHKNDKIIIFNEYNEQTSKVYWYLLDVGIKACIVHSNIDKEKREQNMIDFKNDKYNVMLTSKVLDEGYNLPKLDVGIISAGNSTAKQTIQRMGRVLRKKDKNSTLYQIYCIRTVEEEHANNRAKLFKQLCSKYNEEFVEA